MCALLSSEVLQAVAVKGLGAVGERNRLFQRTKVKNKNKIKI